MTFLCRSLTRAALLLLVLWSAAAVGQNRTFQFQVHPVFPPDQAQLVFTPLLDYLTAATGFTFELQTSRDFHRHWLDLRRGSAPDFVLDDAHLIALRMQRDNFIALVRASAPVTFSLLTNRPERDLELDDFVGLPVSSLPAPSLGHLVVASWFPNPMQQPVIQSAATSWREAVEIVFAMEAEAAIVPNNLASRYVNLSEIAVSSEFPHMSIAASPDLEQAVVDEVRNALIALHDDPDFFAVLHELDIERFVPASPDEYAGLESWLDPIYSPR
jgi:hypothetical protein